MGIVKEVTNTQGGKSVECDLFIENQNGEKAVVGRGIGKLT